MSSPRPRQVSPVRPTIRRSRPSDPAGAGRNGGRSRARRLAAWRHRPAAALAVLVAAFAFGEVQQVWSTAAARRAAADIADLRDVRTSVLNYRVGIELQREGQHLLVEGRAADGRRRLELGRARSEDAWTRLGLPGVLSAMHRNRIRSNAEVLQRQTRFVDEHGRLPDRAGAVTDRMDSDFRLIADDLNARVARREADHVAAARRREVLTLITTNTVYLFALLVVARLTRRLWREQQFAGQLVAASPAGVVWFDRDNRIVGCNQRFAEIRGFADPADAIGRRASDLDMPAEQARSLMAVNREVVRTGEPRLNVQHVVDGPQGTRTLNVSRVPLHDRRGRVSGVLVNVHDDTERAVAARELRDATAHLAMGLDAAHAGEFDWNIATGDVVFSDRWQKLHGFRPGRLRPHISQWDELVHPEDAPAARAAIDAHFAGDTEDFRAEYRMKQGHGGYRWTLGCGRVTERNAVGVPLRMQGLNLDIEPAKQNERALEAVARRAEEASLAKSRFLTVMSHELRTPLTGVIGMAELLLDTPLTVRQRGFVVTCRDSGQLLLKQINDLLDFSKIEAGRLVLERRPFAIARCLDRAASVMAVHAHRKGLELETRLHPGLPRWVVGDPTRLGQVLVNLLANAVKFTDAGRVRVSVRPAPRPASTNAAAPANSDVRWVRFEVHDTGAGIAEDRLPLLFEPFVQSDPSVTRRYGGTGLGLSICRGIVRGMSGEIDVDSRPGRGSTFGFTVRLDRAARPGVIEPGDTAEFAAVPRLDPAARATHTLLLASAGPARDDLHDRLTGLGLDVTTLDPNAVDDQAPPAGFGLIVADLPARDPKPACRRVATLPPSVAPRRLLLTPLTYHPVHPTGGGRVTHPLNKPATDAALTEALSALLAADPDEAAPTAMPLGRPHVIPGPAAAPVAEPDRASEFGANPAPARVLVVEDDATSGLYVSELLARHGLDCERVETGPAAVAACCRALDRPAGGFELVLMDYHLPELDGWSATRQIRAAERVAAARPAVVLGVTAGAGVSDRANGRDAGLDGFLEKPLAPEAFAAVLRQHLPDAPCPSVTQQSGPARPVDRAAPLDPAAALERCMGDADFLDALLASFLTQIPEQLGRLIDAAAASDPTAAGEAAHAIKGAAGLVTAATLRDHAAACEAACLHPTDPPQTRTSFPPPPPAGGPKPNAVSLSSSRSVPTTRPPPHPPGPIRPEPGHRPAARRPCGHTPSFDRPATSWHSCPNASHAYFTSCTVVNGPKLSRVVPPPACVPTVLWASGAQWIPARVRMPKSASSRSASPTGSSKPSIRTLNTAQRSATPGGPYSVRPGIAASASVCPAQPPPSPSIICLISSRSWAHSVSTPRSRIHFTPSLNPTRPIALWLPGSNRSGMKSGCTSRSDRLPVPPSRTVRIIFSTPGRM